MKARLLVALAAGLVVGAADPVLDLGKVEQEQVIPPGSRWVNEGPVVWEFGEDGILRWFGADGKQMWAVRYTLDWKTNPPRFDMVMGNEVSKGIYRVKGDHLTICNQRAGVETRPTRFTHRPEAGQTLDVFRRLK